MSRFDNLNHEDPVEKRIDMWLNSCMCDNIKPYCTYCTVLWDARDRIEVLGSILCARSFDEGMVQYVYVDDSSADAYLDLTDGTGSIRPEEQSASS